MGDLQMKEVIEKNRYHLFTYLKTKTAKQNEINEVNEMHKMN